MIEPPNTEVPNPQNITKHNTPRPGKIFSFIQDPEKNANDQTSIIFELFSLSESKWGKLRGFGAPVTGSITGQGRVTLQGSP